MDFRTKRLVARTIVMLSMVYIMFFLYSGSLQWATFEISDPIADAGLSIIAAFSLLLGVAGKSFFDNGGHHDTNDDESNTSNALPFVPPRTVVYGDTCNKESEQSFGRFARKLRVE